LKKQIKHLEEKSIADKPWQLTGEVTSQQRPVNSLLEEVFTFDHMTRTTPTITEDTTRNLEEIIKQRIHDEVILYVVVIDGVILIVVILGNSWSVG